MSIEDMIYHCIDWAKSVGGTFTLTWGQHGWVAYISWGPLWNLKHRSSSDATLQGALEELVRNLNGILS